MPTGAARHGPKMTLGASLGIGVVSEIPQPAVMALEETEGLEAGQRSEHVDVSEDVYPRCIVWTPIPGCTWCFPFIGHMGIGTESGQVMEFMGFGATKAPKGGLSFGPVCRYVQLSARGVRRGTWDDAIRAAAAKASGRPHGACISNCHSFVADCLHEMRYGGVPCWNWLSYTLAIWVFFLGRFTTCPRTTVFLVPVAIALTVIFFMSHAK
ncbi:unnamed protein product [Effrenium voratum]|nr:unnamed protein product [Effrenium voratum]CAJ1443600.1 unnamed protein product [Effrenium voratum]|mmetsp:Transcript_107324/g.256311  ORF Transcript_107324/g.256311 Transcript_107324/m.256311 type:complete len:211 (-) Transcript_107324:37-669(-)